MPYFQIEEEIEIDPFEYVMSCSEGEIKELINGLVDDGHLPESVLTLYKENEQSKMLEQDFDEKMNKLSKTYYSMSKEDIESLEEMFKKYL